MTQGNQKRMCNDRGLYRDSERPGPSPGAIRVGMRTVTSIGPGVSHLDVRKPGQHQIISKSLNEHRDFLYRVYK